MTRPLPRSSLSVSSEAHVIARQGMPKESQTFGSRKFATTVGDALKREQTVKDWNIARLGHVEELTTESPVLWLVELGV